GRSGQQKRIGPGRIIDQVAPLPHGPYSQCCCDQAFGGVMTVLVEVDSFCPAGPSPPRNLTIAAVDVHLHLGEENCEHRSPDPRNEQAAGDAPAGHTDQAGDAVRADLRTDEQHREVDRDMAQIELSRPVLGVLSTADLDRLCLGPKLRQCRVFRRRLFGHVRSSLIYGWYSATIARSSRRYSQDLPSSVLMRVVEISGVRGR